jgi:hypothetical protein
LKSRGPALSSCPSQNGLEPFTTGAIAQAKQIARNYLSNQFASDIAVTDRSWWEADFNDYAGGNDLGRHTLSSETPASKTPAAAGLTTACGPELLDDSIAVTVGKSGYSDLPEPSTSSTEPAIHWSTTCDEPRSHTSRLAKQ